MKIDDELIEHVASLAKLEFDDDQKAEFASQFSEIVSFVEQLSEADTTGLDDDLINKFSVNVLCSDKAVSGLSRGDALANAPKADDQFLLVPKVIADE